VAAAEDLVQDAFVRSASRISSIPDGEQRAYLRTVVINGWRNEHRHRLVEHRLRFSDVRDVDAPAFEEHDELWEAVSRLPERQRACVALRYYEDLPEAEVARILGCRVER
jgi:RNA polymerase sigma factor (sigma-70 family)